MALSPLNLGDALREAVDGPAEGFDDLVGEDPADVDLPALSARIRHRRRARAGTRSALGVAAAGAVALVGTTGLGSGRAQTFAGLATAPLSASAAALCGHDVSTIPTTDALRLLPTSVAVVSDGSGSVGVAGDATNLGTLVGRTLTATLLQRSPVATTSDTLVLTRGSTFVAAGTAVQQTGTTVAVQDATTGGVVQAISPVATDLAPCPSSGADLTAVPAGTYSVQYVVGEGGGNGPERAAAGPWLVTLLDEPPSVTLPDGFPDTEVPVVSGKLLSAERRTDADGWTVRVAVDGDDALTRAATALRQADAVVGQRDAAVVTPMTGAFATRTWFDDTGDSGTSDRQAQLADLQEELAELQAQRDAAAAEVADGEQALDALVASDAQQDSLSWAARQLQTAKDGLAGLDTRIEAKQLEITSQQMLVDLDAATAEQQRQLDAARAAAAASQAESYTFVGSSTLTATTHTWSVDVDQSRLDGRTVLTYTLTKH